MHHAKSAHDALGTDWDHGNIDGHINTFEAILWDNGGLMFNYQQMSPVHVS